MSDIKRYEPYLPCEGIGSMDEDETGSYVSYDDFFKLEALLSASQAREAELEQRVTVLVDAAEGMMRWQVKNVKVWHNSAYDYMQKVIDALPQQTAEQIESGHIKWLRNQAPTLYMQSDHVSKFVHQACGSDSMFARCSYRQLHTDYVPLIAIPLPESKE